MLLTEFSFLFDSKQHSLGLEIIHLAAFIIIIFFTHDIFDQATSDEKKTPTNRPGEELVSQHFF